MKIYNSLVDDNGVKWEFFYTETTEYEEGPDGEMVAKPTVVTELKYRRESEPKSALQELPPWADIRDEWKINLCMFDEDDETLDVTTWAVRS